MFTGIISTLGRVERLSPQPDTQGIRICVRIADPSFADVVLGESIAHNGVCLTVVQKTGIKKTGSVSDHFVFSYDLAPETLRSTALDALREGSLVNIERAMKLGERLSGHWVQGHVDGVGHIQEILPENDCFTLKVSIPRELSRYVILKGSMTVDGISLTVQGLSENPDRQWVQFQIIPHTWEVTRLKTLAVGDPVNLEVDLVAKHIERLIHAYPKT